MEYKITLTEAQNKALHYAFKDPQEWMDNLVHHRCEVSINEIVEKEVERITNVGGTISGSKEDLVLAAPIKSAKEMEDERTELRAQMGGSSQ